MLSRILIWLVAGILLSYSVMASASVITTKIEGRFLLGDVVSMWGEDVTEENLLASGDASGLGTSSIEFAVGICDPDFPPPQGCDGATEVQYGGDPNKLTFQNSLREGGIPTDSFLIGEFSFTNNDIVWNEFIINSLYLEVSAIECDQNGENCDESTRHTGTTELVFAFTENIPGNNKASADGMCFETELGAGDELCSWVPEFATETFKIFGRFGSLIIEDIIPESAGGFVTVGQDSSQNIKYGDVPEPSLISMLFGLFFILAFNKRRC